MRGLCQVFLGTFLVCSIAWVLAAAFSQFASSISASSLQPHTPRGFHRAASTRERENEWGDLFWIVQVHYFSILILRVIQVSDLHFSKYYDESRQSDLFEFCNETISRIAPSHVLVTGDLTDAKDKQLVFSGQVQTIQIVS
jgi:hypothetical protein